MLLVEWVAGTYQIAAATAITAEAMTHGSTRIGALLRRATVTATTAARRHSAMAMYADE